MNNQIVEQGRRAPQRAFVYRRMISEMDRLGWSKNYLAQQLGVGADAVGKWMGGTVEPSAFYVKFMATLFGCSTDYLLGMGES